MSDPLSSSDDGNLSKEWADYDSDSTGWPSARGSQEDVSSLQTGTVRRFKEQRQLDDLASSKVQGLAGSLVWDYSFTALVGNTLLAEAGEALPSASLAPDPPKEITLDMIYQSIIAHHA